MKERVANNYGSFPVVFTKGKGAKLRDIHGKEYIDFVSGIGVNCLGHNHPALVTAIQKQVEKQIHISNYYISDIGVSYTDALLKATEMEGVFYCNSGAEANEAAIKLARKYGFGIQAQKKTIVTLKQSFHGRTLTTLSATGQEKFHPESFAPYTPDFKHMKANDYAALDFIDASVCAIMIEAVQGEGGVNLIDADWAQALEKKAREVDALFIVDEVQTGMMRTGSLLASTTLGINPDIITLAKGIAGGVPMGACLFRGRAKDVFVAGDHQSTFGGNPLALAAAKAVLKEINTECMQNHVIKMGEKIQNTIRSWNLDIIQEVRGRGLMIGIDINFEAAPFQKACLDNGLCVTTAGPKTLRFLPPLIISEAEIETGLAIFREVLTA